MLTRIKIFQLFNVYNYDIDLTNTDGSAVKFITAPNGYGKTTILDFIAAAIRQTYDKMFQMPFKSFELFFDEVGAEAVYQYSVDRTDEESKAVDTDIVQTLSKKLQIRLSRISCSDKTLIEEFTVIQAADGTITMSGNTDNIQMFFESRTCYYLNDQRMLSMKMDLKDETLIIDNNTRAIDRMRPYPGELKDILSSPEKSKEYESRIACFQAIINRCEFANKHLEIEKRFGFRFMAEDELHTILSLDQLSSGEKQMIIQVFELLFHAQSGTLVMIDEPELSLHMMWQMNYLKNLSEIAQLRGFQCIVATHSPQIFNSLWSKSVDLFTLSIQE
jgi:predicted ATP-binding protein involved in virulence